MFVVDSAQPVSLSIIEGLKIPRNTSKDTRYVLNKLESISRKINAAKSESANENDKFIRLQEIMAEHMELKPKTTSLTGGDERKDDLMKAIETIYETQREEIEELRDGKSEFGVPKITLPKLSKYEYAGILTAFSNYLTTKDSLYPIVESDTIVRGLVNPCAIAFEAIRKGKIDVVIDRGYERVLLSKVKINPIWEKDLENFFSRWYESAKDITATLIQ